MPKSLFRAACLAACLAFTPLGLAAHADDEMQNPHLSAQDLADLDRVSAYLNDLTTLKGSFVQLSSNGGMATGTFYMRKPGRIRFEYDPPVQVLFVSNGTFVSVEDKELETVNSYPLSATPLKLLLDDRINLAEDTTVTDLDREEGRLFVTAEEEDGLAQGRLTMIFSEPDLELRQWVIMDAQGIETTIALRDVVHGVSLDPALFVPTDYDFEDVRD